MTLTFHDDAFHTGFFAPMRFEADIHDCEVEGRIPPQLDGSFYRTCLDRRYPQRLPNDIPYNADGAVDLFRFRNGHGLDKPPQGNVEEFLHHLVADDAFSRCHSFPDELRRALGLGR